MALDIQPLDIQPINAELDIQPLDIQPLDSPKEEASIGTALKSAFAGVGTTADTALSMLAGGAAGLFGDDAGQEDIYKQMEERAKSRQQWANPEGQKIGTLGKVAGIAATLPMQIAASGLSPAETGAEMLRAGETLPRAMGGAAIDAAGNIVGMVAPGFKQGSALVRGTTGAAANMAQEAATKQAISSLAETKAAQEKFAPTLEDTLIAGAMGGATALAAGKARPKDTGPTNRAEAVMESLRPEKPLDIQPLVVDVPEGVVKQTPMERVATELGAEAPVPPKSPMEAMAETLVPKEKAIAEEGAPVVKAGEEGTGLPRAEESPFPTIDTSALELAPLDKPLREFVPNAQAKDGSPIQIDRTVEQSGISYKARDAEGNVVAQVFFEQNRDGSLGAGHVQSFDPGKGLAESLYRKAKEEGFTIRPGRAQTEQGAGMVKALQAKGLIEPGKITPTSEFQELGNRVSDYQPSDKPFKKKEDTIPVAAEQGPGLEALKNIPGMRNKLGVFEPDLLTTEQFMEKFGDAPDIQQNVAQRAMNATSKGGQYVAARTNDPYIKRATQRVRTAVNRSQAAIRDLIHSDKGGYAPMLRSLDKKEYIELAQLLKAADKENIVITPMAMKEKGFSDKAVAAMEAHKAFTAKLQGPLKEAAELAGIKDVDMRVAYAASRANHDFRVPVLSKHGEIVGILTAPTRLQLNRSIAKYKAIDPSVSMGPEQYFGGSRSSKNVEGFSQLYQWLADQNPEVAKFADVLMEMNSQAAASYMGAKKHTMDKKGVFGMAGDDPFASPYKNAQDFWDSQVKYGESVIKWAEMSKAAQDVAPLFANPNRPNANAYIKSYVDNAMGRNPSEIGRAIDDVFATVGKKTGIGTELPGFVMSKVKQAVNTKLLAFSPAFLAANIIQPMKTAPEMFSWLNSRGLDNSIFGHDHLVKGAAQAANLIGKNDPIVQGALKYAEDNHVYSSDLFEASNKTRRNFGHYVDKLSVPASKIESGTRQTFFLSMVDALRANGYTPDNGLYQTAHNLTDMAMNNYNASEAPLAYGLPGRAVGGAAMNLMSFKQNELSRIAFFLEEAKDNKAVIPLAVNLMAQVASGGLMGTVLYTEADWFVRKISEMLGKPTSLTDILLTSKLIPDVVKYGLGSLAGIDLTSRMGLGQVTPDVAAVMPGLPSLIDQGASYVEAARNPTEYNLKRAVRETMPVGPAQGIADLAMFSPNDMALNQKKGTAQVKRTQGDIIAKAAGVTGLHESMAKKRNYEESKIDQFYSDKRKAALDDLGKALITENANDKRDAINKYVKFRGDPNTLNKDLERLALEGLIDERTRSLLASQQATINNAYKLRSRAR